MPVVVSRTLLARRGCAVALYALHAALLLRGSDLDEGKVGVEVVAGLLPSSPTADQWRQQDRRGLAPSKKHLLLAYGCDNA